MQDAAVKTVDRITATPRVLSGRGEAGADLSGKTGLAEPTAHRPFAAPSKARHASQDRGSRRHRLGAAAALGRAARHRTVAALARPALDQTAGATGDTAFASVREGPPAVYVARAVDAFPIMTVALEVGDRRPSGVGAGSLALLPGLDAGAGGPAAALSLAAIRDCTGPDRPPRLVAVRQDEARRLEAEIRSGGGQA